MQPPEPAKSARQQAADAAAARQHRAKKDLERFKGSVVLDKAARDPLAPGRSAGTVSPPKTWGSGRVGNGAAKAPQSTPASGASGAGDE